MKYYISITGMQLHSALHFPKFAYYTFPAMGQAKGAPGNVSADGKAALDGQVNTLSVWEDRKSMSRYMASGAHAKAMKIVSTITTDGASVYGYESDTIPTWTEALAILEEKGVRHGAPQKKITQESKISTPSSFKGLAPVILAVALVSVVYSISI
jgi:hypothetical protein